MQSVHRAELPDAPYQQLLALLTASMLRVQETMTVTGIYFRCGVVVGEVQGGDAISIFSTANWRHLTATPAIGSGSSFRGVMVALIKFCSARKPSSALCAASTLTLALRRWRDRFLSGGGFFSPNMAAMSSSGETGLAGTPSPTELFRNAGHCSSRGDSLLATARWLTRSTAATRSSRGRVPAEDRRGWAWQRHSGWGGEAEGPGR